MKITKKMVLFLFGFTLLSSAFQAQTSQATIKLESVVMGTDGQMRARINGEYLTRQSVKDGIKVLDINYQQVKLEFQGRQINLSPGQIWTDKQN